MYQVLARKYRSQRLSDLIGQSMIVKALSNCIKFKQLPHSFLFTGVRGTGKTSIARILAKSLNCINSDGHGKETINPCGICNPCISISKGNNIDVIEIDAASRTGIDDVREIIENTKYKPVYTRYKIYIFDEVHMLSKNSFNALLKIIEEPPNHVKFLLLTTEINKIPLTILSRCVHFNLNSLNIKELIKLMLIVLSKEKIPFENEILEPLAIAAEGSARDVLFLLERAIMLNNKKITEKTIQEMLGLASAHEIKKLFLSMISGKINILLNLYSNLYKKGRTPSSILKMLLSYISTQIKIYSLQKNEKNNLSITILHRLWQGTLKGLKDIENAPIDFQAGEIVLIRLSYISNVPDLEEIVYKQQQIMLKQSNSIKKIET